MKFIAIFTIVLVLVKCISASNSTNCSAQSLRECANSLLNTAFDDTKEIPGTVEEVQGHCADIKRSSRCVRQWINDCAPKSAQQMSRVVFTSVNKRIKKYCSSEGIEEILRPEHVSCMKMIRVPIKVCFREGVTNIYKIRQIEDRKKWHPLMCCLGTRSMNCGLNAVRSNCPETTSRYFERQASQFTEEILDTFCSSNLQYGSKECDKLISEMPEIETPPAQEISVVQILLDIMREVVAD